MVVEMADRLAGTLTNIGYHPETTPGDTFRMGNRLDCPLDGSEQIVVRWIQLQGRDDMLTWDNQDMHRGYRVDVTERDYQIIAINDVALDYSRRNRTEDAIQPSPHLHPRYQPDGMSSSANCGRPAPLECRGPYPSWIRAI